MTTRMTDERLEEIAADPFCQTAEIDELLAEARRARAAEKTLNARWQGAEGALGAHRDVLLKENANLRARVAELEKSIDVTLDSIWQCILGSHVSPKDAEYLVRHIKKRLGRGEETP